MSKYQKELKKLKSLIESYAERSLSETWHRSSLKGKPRESDETAVGRFLIHIFEDGGGYKERGILKKQIRKTILSKLIEIQGGEYVDHRTDEQREADKHHPGAKFNAPKGIKFIKKEK